MKKSNILVAVLAMSFIILSYVAITPIIAAISKSFPDFSIGDIQLVITLVSLSSIPTMLLSGKLVFSMTKKNISLVGLILILLGGLFPVFFNDNILFLYFSSVIIGAGTGLVSIMSSTIISDYFDGADKGRIMGYQSACVSIGGALLSYLSGFIATINWKYSYLCFSLLLIIIFLVVFFLPQDVVTKKSQNTKTSMPPKLYWLGFITFLFYVFINSFNTTISLLFEKLGYPSSYSGLATSFFTLMGIVAGILMAPILRIFRNNTLTFATFIALAGFLLLFFSRQANLLYIGSAILGFAFAVRNPAGITFAANMVRGEDSAKAIAIFNACTQLGAFISPLLLNYINSFIEGGPSTVFAICSVGILLTGLLHFLFNPIRKSKG